MTTALDTATAPDALLAAFRATATATISDNLSRLPGFVGLRPFHRLEGVMAGRALTVRTAVGDNPANRRARPGGCRTRRKAA